MIRSVYVALGFSIVLSSASAANVRTFDISSYGAVGDGKADDTDAINQAIEACSAAGGGQVIFPPGKYRSGTVHLKSHVALIFQAQSRLIGTDDLSRYQQFKPPEGTHEARFRPAWHRGLILGIGVEDVMIAGKGVIDGAQVFDPQGEERMRGPHTILFGDSRQISIQGVSIHDSANYAVMLEHCHSVDIRNIKVTGGWDAVHFRGWQDKPCTDISIVGCQFFTGDDCIAGRYWKDVVIKDCVINSSCNGIRVIGPAERLIIHDCLFFGPGRYEHRTSKRHNMLAGVILQPGAWDSTQGHLDEVLIADNTMRNVTTPLQITLDEGNTAGEVVVDSLRATGVYRAALSVESWTEDPIERIVMRDVAVEYAGGGSIRETTMDVPPPGLDARRLPTWGFFGRNVAQLVFDNVRFSTAKPDLRHALMLSNISKLQVDGLRFPIAEGSAAPVVLNDVRDVSADDAPRFSKSRLISGDK